MKQPTKVWRKTLIVAFILFISLCSLKCLFPISVCYAKSSEQITEKELEESIQEQLGRLDLDELKEYIEELGVVEGDDFYDRLFALIQGEGFSYQSFWERLSTVFFAKVINVLPAFATIAAVTILSGLISSLKSGATGKSAGEMIYLITYAAALIPLISVVLECFSATSSAMSSMQKQSSLFFPLMITLMAASGGTLSAAICKPAVAFFSTNILSVLTNIVLPITITIIVFSVIGSLTQELKIGKFAAFFKSINKWIIGISVTVFGLFFTLQGVTAATHDGVLRRTVKYAIGNGVPIVGGFLSGGFDLAIAGSILIKNALGSMGIFLMVSILFEPLILLLSVNILLRLTAAITQPFGDSRISDFLEDTATNLQYCTACLLFSGFLYFIAMMLMIASTEVLF